MEQEQRDRLLFPSCGGVGGGFISPKRGKSARKPLMNKHPPSVLSRREFLWRFGGGLGGIALAHLLGQHGLLVGDETGNLAPVGSALTGALRNGPHRPGRAKRVIQLFMNGGASQMDLFDYKPELIKRHGQKFDPGTGERVEAATSEPAP